AGGEDIASSLTTSESDQAGIVGEASSAYGRSSATISSSACSGPGT
nr:hypothetical protein [Tanacetum cinerariifolium]